MIDETDDQPEFVTINGVQCKIDYSGNLGRGTEDEEPEGPSKFERWQAMAEQGDIQALLDEAPLDSEMATEVLRDYIIIAMDKHARGNPTSFANFLQTAISACAGKMVIRAQYLLELQIRRQRTNLKIWADNKEIDVTTEKVMMLMSETAKLLHVSANTQLTLEHVRKMRSANDKAEAKKNRPRQPRRRRTSPRPHATAPNSRIGGEFP